MYYCFHCGAKAVIWGADFNTEDYGYEPGGIVHECTCANCGAEIQYVVYPGGVVHEKDETARRLYDEIERHENCTVEILRDSKTGEESVGWWENVEAKK